MIQCEMKKKAVRKVLSYAILSVGIGIIGILLIPAGIMFLLIYAAWSITDRILRLLEENTQE